MTSEGATFSHWRTEQDADGIVWLTFDHAERKVNTLSRAALVELAAVLENIAGLAPAGLVIRSAKTNGFIAGADITEFTALADADQALALIGEGQGVLNRLSSLPFPTVSIIHGFCLGGGMELALACRYRVAADTPETQLGLPEVKLGIHPGFGGTVRLPRLIGPLAALEMMLTGKSASPRRARKIGLVDYAVPPRHLERAARTLVLHAPAPVRPGLLASLCTAWFMRPLLAGYLRRETAKRARKNHYPAPYAIIDLWERYAGDPAVMLREEVASIARLIVGKSSRNLVRAFLLREELSALGRSGASPPAAVHVIGAGTMGGDIAAWCALQGLKVTIQDVDQGRLAKVVKRAALLYRKELRDPRRAEAALDRLIPDIKGVGIAKADVVIEAIFEDPAAKRDLYRQVEPLMAENAILATNTSSIPLEDLTAVLARPERLVGLHFFNPVAKMQLVEVVRGAATSPEAIAKASALVARIKRLPLPVMSSPGFLVNRILMPYLMEAVLMEAEGVPAAEIDAAAVAFGMPMGPLLLADTVGLDVCLSVARILAGKFNIEPPKRLEELVATGRLGKKSGSGFYAYRDGKPVVSGRKRKRHPSTELEERLVLRFLNEAVACWREGIATDADLIDAGVIFGTGFAPFRGGPLAHARSEGVAFLHGRLNTFEERYGSRFTPDPGWLELPVESQIP